MIILQTTKKKQSHKEMQMRQMNKTRIIKINLIKTKMNKI